MPGARFQFFTRRAGTVEWRLISSNNWELGRCPAPFDDLAGCSAAVDRVRAGVGGAREVVSQDAAGGWRWQLRMQGDVVALSSRSHGRRVECEGTLTQFRRVAAEADSEPRLRTFR